MLRTLLEDRLKLKIRRRTTEIPVYALVVADGGAKLQPAREEGCVLLNPDEPRAIPPGAPQSPICGGFAPSRSGKGLTTYHQTMPGLARQLSSFFDRDVIDRTLINGTFDIELTVDLRSLGTHSSDAPVAGAQDANETLLPVGTTGGERSALLFGTFQKGLRMLGLKLEPAKTPAEVLIVDRVERPSEN